MLLGQRAQLPQEGVRGRNDSGLALDRLQHDRRGLGADQRPHRLRIVEPGLGKARHLRRVDGIPAGFAGGRHGGQGAAVKGIFEGNDLERALAMLAAPFAGQLDGPFVGLGSGIGEKDPVENRATDEALGQFHGRRIVEGGAGIDEPGGLVGQGACDGRVAVAQAVDRPALDEIEVAFAGLVREPGTLAAGHDDFGPGCDPHEAVGLVRRKVGALCSHIRSLSSGPCRAMASVRDGGAGRCQRTAGNRARTSDCSPGGPRVRGRALPRRRCRA